MAPKVGDWVTTVTSACLQSKMIMINIIIIKHYHHHHHNHIIHYHHLADLSFQDPLTSRVWTRFALLLLPSLVADGRPDRHLVMMMMMVLMIMVQILLVLIIMMMLMTMLMTLPQPR